MIDSFQHHPGITTYLLSHLHSDHTSGLSPSWNNGIIYTTKLSAFLLKDKFHVNPDLIVELDYDETVYVDLTKGTVTHKNHSATCIQISVIDANHCVGSCMFFLEGYFGNILATGDFRFDSKILGHHSLQDKEIDHLFLDDTFAEPEYVFSSRPEAGKQILSIIQKYPDNYRICVATDTLGKEELLVAIAMKFKSLVVVSEERLHQLNVMRRVIDLPDVFTSDQSQGRIVCLGKRQINFKSIVQMRQQRPTVGILPSGWSQTMLTKSSTQNTDPLRKLIWRVGYSLHSSFPELETFVKTLKPRCLHSGSRHDEDNLKRYFQKYCSEEAPRDYITPKAIQEAMISKIQQQAAVVTPRRSITKRKSPLLNMSQTSSGRRHSKHLLSSSGKRHKRMRGAKIPEIISDDASSSSLEEESLKGDIVIVEDSDDDDSRGALSDDEESLIHEIIDVEAMDIDGIGCVSLREGPHISGTQQLPIVVTNEGTVESTPAKSSLYAKLFSHDDSESDDDDDEIARILAGMFDERAQPTNVKNCDVSGRGNRITAHSNRDSSEVIAIDSDEDNEELGNLLNRIATNGVSETSTSDIIPSPTRMQVAEDRFCSPNPADETRHVHLSLTNNTAHHSSTATWSHKRKRHISAVAEISQEDCAIGTPLVKRRKVKSQAPSSQAAQQIISISDSD